MVVLAEVKQLPCQLLCNNAVSPVFPALCPFLFRYSCNSVQIYQASKQAMVPDTVDTLLHNSMLWTIQQIVSRFLDLKQQQKPQLKVRQEAVPWSLIFAEQL